MAIIKGPTLVHVLNIKAEAQAVRIAIRKIAAAKGGYVALAVKIGVPTSTLYHAVPDRRAVTRARDPSRRRGRAVVAHIVGVEDAATSKRVPSRAFLGRDMLHELRMLEAWIDAAAPPEHGDPAGSGGTGPTH